MCTVTFLASLKTAKAARYRDTLVVSERAHGIHVFRMLA